MGFRSKRCRKAATPPKITPQQAQSISASLGITNQPVHGSNANLEDSLNDPVLAQYMPFPDQAEPSTPPIPDDADHFAQESREYWKEEARRRQKLQWKEIEVPMTATYLELQHKRRNWTSEASYLDQNIHCQCSDSELTLQPLDLIDILGFHSKTYISFFNMYRSIMLCTKKIYNEGLTLSNAQLLADRCGRCFGPAINEEHLPQEPHVIVALDGNFQHRHYTQSSKDNPTEDEYPEIFIKPSDMKKHEILQHSTEAQAKNIKVGITN
ncbi:uncharacterized protein MELLADRAFT_111785 [Melampsora larici-populina 98AG31]|uniref:CxC1-like cysteine cluster associated with KDZ transposases domain-containing protein n=1 Tax=Melampsora larici-populina (strain 98AG31 / pathotype 3-4-7) TaxID=747676 RepID=F4S482_MELLP|nr:uncharacterized protein MELLADRAFT_111785 [Melampsora larici-populina 98AG31]EGG00551.1 hypothetical protein MELLADRAFT_111785 [Melampsora larici-populina 98AG31]